MTLPTFLVIGAMKAGTSSLHRYLGAHPDIFVSDEKEPDFFCGGEAWDRGLAWYEGLFAAGDGVRARGESSTRYSKDPLFPGVPARVARIVPDVRLVYLLRDPVERIRSHHRHAVAEWGHPPVLADALWAHPGEYLVPTRYAHQLGCWLDHFPRDQVLVVTSEDLDADRDTTVATVCSFLGVDASWRPTDDRRYNQAVDHRASAGVVGRLRDASVYRTVKDRIPKRLRHAAWKATSRPAAEAQPVAPDDLAAVVVDELGDDLARLAELLPGFHCWNLLGRDPGAGRASP